MDVWSEVFVFFLGLFLTYHLVMRFLRKQRISAINDKHVLVTGCDKGFGHAIALKLDKMGCHVTAACYTEKGEDEIKKKSSPRLCTIHLDINNPESIKKAFQFVSDRVPPKQGLWGLVNNAAVTSAQGPAEWFSRDYYRNIIETNTLGTIDVTLQFLPLIKKSKGRIVFMSSLDGILSVPRFAPYTISKYGVEAFADCLRRELCIYGVSVHIIEPGGYKTGMIEQIGILSAEHYKTLPPHIQKEYGDEFLQTSLQMVNSFNDKVSSDFTPVVDVVTNAVTGLFPRTRYQTGVEGWIFPFIQSLPTCVSDFILKYAIVALNKPAILQKK